MRVTVHLSLSAKRRALLRRWLERAESDLKRNGCYADMTAEETRAIDQVLFDINRDLQEAQERGIQRGFNN